MKKSIDTLAQFLKKNNIPVPQDARKKDGGSSLDNKERFHALVVVSLDSSSFIINSGASRSMGSVKYFFTSMYLYIGSTV